MFDEARLRSSQAPPHLLAGVRASAYQYFRLFASEFSQRSCAAFRDVSWQLPTVAVHGDAHLLQFVVTEKSFGLEDFDRSGFGPSIVDILRYAVSLHLACREMSWQCDPELAVESFIGAFEVALGQAASEVPTPTVVQRLRRQVPDGTAWLSWADSLMLPLQARDRERIAAAASAFVNQQLEVRPDRPASYYEVIRAGRLRMGVGSALERKLLFRIAGPSPDPGDDLIVEARATTPHGDCDCVWWPTQGRSFQAMMFMSLLGRRMPTLFGYGDYGGDGERQEYWVQAWDPGYRELRLKDIQNQAELLELVRDAATQLGGHFWTGYPEPLRHHQRFAQLSALQLVDHRVPAVARRLTRDLLAAWRGFRERTESALVGPHTETSISR